MNKMMIPLILILLGICGMAVIVESGVSFIGTKTNYTTSRNYTANLITLSGNELALDGYSMDIHGVSGGLTVLVDDLTNTNMNFTLYQTGSSSVYFGLGGVDSDSRFTIYHDGSAYDSILSNGCLLYTSDAADEEDSVESSCRRIFKL